MSKPDKITLERINLLHPRLREETRDLYMTRIVPALSERSQCRFAYTLRSFTEQAALYELGRTRLFDAQGRRQGVVTNAKAGMSYHQYGLSVDIVLLVDRDNNGTFETASWDTRTDWDRDGLADWGECVRIFKSAGWTWGGDWAKFPDKPHFEKTFGLSVKECMARHIARDFIPGTTYIKI